MLCCERRDEHFRIHRVTRDHGPDDNATTEAANTSVALHPPFALNHSDLANCKKRVEQPGAPHTAGPVIEIANCIGVLGTKRTNSAIRWQLGRGGRQYRLMLVDLSTGNEAESFVETIALARRIEDDGPSA